MATNSGLVSVIDVSPFFDGTAEGKRKVAEEVAKACESIGFLSIVGHGIPQSLIDKMYDTSKAFFELPADEKVKLRPPSREIERGYSPVASEAVSYSLDEESPADWRELYTVGRCNISTEDTAYFQDLTARKLFYPNIWADNPKEFRSVWTEYYRAMETLASKLMKIFAVALDLSENFFDDKIDKHLSSLVAVNYPAQLEDPKPRQLRAGAHTDYGSLTILRQDEALGGLQVLNQAGEWIDIKPIPDSFVINLGDLMAQWTNDRWISTMHRVVNPPHAQGASSQ